MYNFSRHSCNHITLLDSLQVLQIQQRLDVNFKKYTNEFQPVAWQFWCGHMSSVITLTWTCYKPLMRSIWHIAYVGWRYDDLVNVEYRAMLYFDYFAATVTMGTKCQVKENQKPLLAYCLEFTTFTNTVNIRRLLRGKTHKLWYIHTGSIWLHHFLVDLDLALFLLFNYCQIRQFNLI